MYKYIYVSVCLSVHRLTLVLTDLWVWIPLALAHLSGKMLLLLKLQHKHTHTHRLVRIHQVKRPKMFTIRSSRVDIQKKGGERVATIIQMKRQLSMYNT